ncbi:MAG: hypothetical protein HXX13_15725 [Bacteroidetes bacterium]|nr:hypothetical protein [Bacteroidota bacterium]
MKRMLSLLLFILIIPSIFSASSHVGKKAPTTENYIVIGWNELGMHCANKFFDNMCILPPYNNHLAQIIKVGSPTQLPEVMGASSGFSVTYEIPGDTYSVGKTNFWSFALQLFGVNLPDNIGLTGNGLTGTMTDTNNYYLATGIPITPYTDNNFLTENPFQLTLLKAFNASNQLIATTQSVIPVSNEINCVSSGCHTSEMDILQHHENVSGFNINNRPIFCATCHADPVLGMPGNGTAPKFSQVIHEKHGEFISTDCYKCHPGPNTQCFRDTMHAAGLTCVNCHGNVFNVGKTVENGRTPWLQEPSCGAAACHGDNFAENPGKLFRESKGHGNLFCSACHNSPHAIVPTNKAEDNLQNITLQGFSGTLRKCSVCHGYTPTAPGPHGLSGNTVPLSGSYIIPSTTYPTIASAFADLNTNGLTSSVTFLIDAGYTENALGLTLTVPEANSTKTITFKKNPSQLGVNPKLIVNTGTSAVTDAGIIIAGTDYVTFESLDIDASAQSTIEWGYALLKRRGASPFDGCQHVTIKGCYVSMNRTNTKSVGIYSGNHVAGSTTSLTLLSASDACNNCQFDNNTVSGAYTGISLNGFSSSAPYTFFDHSNEIGQFGKNSVLNFGGSNVAAYGIYVASQDQVKIMNDSVVSGAGSTNRLAGIALSGSTGSSADISGNYVMVASSATTNQNVYGIWNNYGSTPSANAIRIHNNRIQSYTSTHTSSGPLYGILNSASADSVLIYDNVISGSSLSGTGTQYGIRSDASGNETSIYNNIIHDLVNTGSGGMIPVYTALFGTANVYSNQIYNCTANGGSVYGIYSLTGTNTWNVYRNSLHGLVSNTGTTASCLVYGVYNNGAAIAEIYNNFISELYTPKATASPAICGLYLTGGSTNNAYFNTIYLNATSTGATFGSAAIYAGTTATVDMRDNIAVNISVPGNSGLTVSYRRADNNLSTYANGSNNNDFYSGTPGPKNLIYFDGTPYVNLADLQALVSPRDNVSFSEIPPFVNVSTPPFNLHIQSAINTLCESGAVSVSLPTINNDLDGDSRYPNAGYPDNIFHPATGPDVGADEFAGGVIPPMRTLNLTLFLESLYSGAAGMNQARDLNGPRFGAGIADQITVELHNAQAYQVIEYTAPNINLGTDGHANVPVPMIYSGNYYITIRHRNSLETTSATAISFSTNTITYNFDFQQMAYGNNVKFINTHYCIFTGDVNQDGIINSSDMLLVQSLGSIFGTGYVHEDINGDGLVDFWDMLLLDNNMAALVMKIVP